MARQLLADWLEILRQEEWFKPEVGEWLEVLAQRVGAERVQQAYLKGLLGRKGKALEELLFEIWCLAQLAKVADKMELLLQEDKANPEARVWLGGHECLVEVKCLGNPEEGFSVRALDHVRLRRSAMSEVPKKFARSPKTVNLVFVTFFASPELGITFVPALYGKRFYQKQFDPSDFRLPSESDLGKDGLFAKDDWRCVSGVVALSMGVWSFPSGKPLNILFPNPRAFVAIPPEVSIRLAAAFNLISIAETAEQWLKAYLALPIGSLANQAVNPNEPATAETEVASCAESAASVD